MMLPTQIPTCKYVCNNYLRMMVSTRAPSYIMRVSTGVCVWGGGGGARGPDTPYKPQKLGFLSNAGPDPVKSHKATKPEFNVGSSSTRQRNAISMVFRWRVDDSPLIVVFGSSLPSSTKNVV